MALRSTHIALSGVIVSSYLIMTKQPAPVDVTCLLGTWIGVQLPDLDTGRTKMNQRLGFLGKLFGWCFRHRTWTHSLWAVILLFGLAEWLPAPMLFDFSGSPNILRDLYLSLAIGYLLHLFEDSFSAAGICWLYPFQRFQRSQTGHLFRKRPWHWYFYRTGGGKEFIIRWISIVILIYQVYLMFQMA